MATMEITMNLGGPLLQNYRDAQSTSEELRLVITGKDFSHRATLIITGYAQQNDGRQIVGSVTLSEIVPVFGKENS